METFLGLFLQAVSPEDVAQFAINDLAVFAVLAPVIAYLWRDMKNRDERHGREVREMRAEHKADYEKLRDQYSRDISELNSKLLVSETARASLEGQNEQMAKRIEDQAAHILRLETRMERVESNGHGNGNTQRKSRFLGR